MNPDKIKSWLFLAVALGATILWGVTMYGLPPRVDKLEQKVYAHEEKLTRADVKMDIVLEDVKTIKAILMQARSGGTR